MKNISLKYRIALVIFVLEAVLMYFVLGPILTSALKETQKQLAVTEQVMLDLLGDLGRIALFTSEYDELQPYIESVVLDPHVKKIYLTNINKLIVVSSDVSMVGQSLPELKSTTTSFWKTKLIKNSAGNLGSLAINFSHSEVSEIINRTRTKGITTAAIGMTIIAITGILMGFLLTRRLDQLSLASQSVTQGNYDIDLDVSGSDEIAVLGRSFENMRRNIRDNIRELNRHQEELEIAKSSLEHRVVERTRELAIARDEALAANKLKSAFVANMSHELRTPLNIILGYSDLLEADLKEAGNSEMAADISKVKESGNQLLEIIESVLALSKIEVGEMPIQLEEEGLSAYFNDIASYVSSWFSSSGNEFIVSNLAEDKTIFTDGVKLRKVLYNILENANKFTTNGKVFFEVENALVDQVECVVFKIRDTGIGMEAKQIEDMFVEFSQVDSSASRNYEGTGLGLTLAKKYCELLGGKIKIHSEPGVGTEAVITLPQKLACDIV